MFIRQTRYFSFFTISSIIRRLKHDHHNLHTRVRRRERLEREENVKCAHSSRQSRAHLRKVDPIFSAQFNELFHCYGDCNFYCARLIILRQSKVRARFDLLRKAESFFFLQKALPHILAFEIRLKVNWWTFYIVENSDLHIFSLLYIITFQGRHGKSEY